MSDDVTTKIEPALTAEEWTLALDEDVREGLAYEVTYLWGQSRPAGAIALANAALPDSDPRKITRAKIRLLRIALAGWDGVGTDPDENDAWINATDDRIAPPVEYFGDAPGGDGLDAFLNALASYLPPEGP